MKNFGYLLACLVPVAWCSAGDDKDFQTTLAEYWLRDLSVPTEPAITFATSEQAAAKAGKGTRSIKNNVPSNNEARKATDNNPLPSNASKAQPNDIRCALDLTRQTLVWIGKLRTVPAAIRNQLESFEEQWHNGQIPPERYDAFYIKIRTLRRHLVLAHPALDFKQILINQNPPTSYSHNGDQHLGMHSRPGPGLTDGSSVAHYFGNDMIAPMEFVEATAIPGTNKVVATAQGHHSYNTGTVVKLDNSLGENGEPSILHITPETPYSETHDWPNPHFSHPYPVTEDLILTSRANHRVPNQGTLPPENDRAIYLVDSLGGREFIYENPAVASFSPIPIRKRIRPHAFPVNARPDTPNDATLYVQNVALTRNDPANKIQPGMIKAIRVNALGVQPRADRSPCSMTVPVEIPKKVLGTVPVGADGSAYFKDAANPL